MKRIYIAGPMRGTKDLNRAVFEELTNYYRSQGWSVESPFEIGARFGTDQELLENKPLLLKVMEFEEQTLRTCDAIALLPGWERSLGATQELLVALQLKLDIFPIPCTKAETVWLDNDED